MPEKLSQLPPTDAARCGGPSPAAPSTAALVPYLSHGALRQCVFCRCYRRGEDHAHWDAVPAFDRDPPAPVSHGLCPACAQLFYPGTMDC